MARGRPTWRGGSGCWCPPMRWSEKNNQHWTPAQSMSPCCYPAFRRETNGGGVRKPCEMRRPAREVECESEEVAPWEVSVTPILVAYLEIDVSVYIRIYVWQRPIGRGWTACGGWMSQWYTDKRRENPNISEMLRDAKQVLIGWVVHVVYSIETLCICRHCLIGSWYKTQPCYWYFPTQFTDFGLKWFVCQV